MEKKYKFVLTPKSFFSDIFSSDTIFGIICWYVRYIYGESKLLEMLKKYDNEPPFIISSLIPNGFIPKPQVPFKQKDSIKEIENDKKFKAIQWLPLQTFIKYQNNYNQDKVIHELIKNGQSIIAEEFEITRNSINRNTGMALEGILFTDTYYYSNMTFTVYVTLFDDSYEDILKNAFITACQMGLGSEASIGKGIFDCLVKELNNDEKQLFATKAKSYFTLSLCAGSNLQPISYSTFTKYGKLGGEFGQAGIDGIRLFNKKPIVYYKEGSTFIANHPVEGTILKNVHTDPRIVQYAYAYPVYFNVSN